MSMISPVSSAIGMNSAGETKPRVGCFQRISVSNDAMAPSRRSMIGWNTSVNCCSADRRADIEFELPALLRRRSRSPSNST